MAKSIYDTEFKNTVIVRRIWHADQPTSLCVWLLFKHDRDGRLRNHPLDPADPSLPSLIEEAQRKGFSVWFSVNAFERPPESLAKQGRGRTADRVRALNALWLDYDFPGKVKEYLRNLEVDHPLTWPEVVKILRNPPADLPVLGKDYPTPGQLIRRIRAAGLPLPTYIWFTGAGYNVVWVLDRPRSLDTPHHRLLASLVERELVKKLGGDVQASDLARVIRFPATINYKYCRHVGILGAVLGGTGKPVKLREFRPLLDAAKADIARQRRAAEAFRQLRDDLLKGGDRREHAARRGIEIYLKLWEVGRRNAILQGLTAFLALLGYSAEEIISLLAPRIEEIDARNPEHAQKLKELKVLAHRAIERLEKNEPLKLFVETESLTWTEDLKKAILSLLDAARRCSSTSSPRKRSSTSRPAGFTKEQPPPPPWLIVGRRTLRIDYPLLAEEVVKETHAHIGTKDGDIAVAFVWDPDRKLYRRDLGPLIKAIYRKLEEGEKYARTVLAEEYPHAATAVLSKKHHVNETLSAIAAHFGVPVDELLRKFNDYSRYIPVKNGLLDMETGQLLERTPEHLYSFELGVEWDPDADTATVDEYLAGLVDPDDLTNLRRFLGYLLVPGQPLKMFAILVGGPDSGKSTFLDLLARTLGEDNVSHESITTLTTNRFAPIKLLGKLANLSSETPELSRGIDVELLKAITGGDAIHLEEKYRPSFSGRIGAKLMFAVNAVPHLPDDPALWARVLLIRFPHRFERSKQAYDRIMSLAPALLRKMVEWRKEVLREGFEGCDIERLQIEALITREPIKAFALTALEPDPHSEEPLIDVYIAFCRWAVKHGFQRGDVHGLVLTPDFVEAKVSEKGAQSVRHKLAAFARCLYKALQELGYICESAERRGDTHHRVVVGVRIKGEWRGTPEVPHNYVEAFNAVVRELPDCFDFEEFKQRIEEYFGEKGEQVAKLLWDAALREGVLAEVRPGLYRAVGKLPGGVRGVRPDTGEVVA